LPSRDTFSDDLVRDQLVTKLEHWVVVAGRIVYYLRRSKMEYRVSSTDVTRFRTQTQCKRERSASSFLTPERLRATVAQVGFESTLLENSDTSPMLVWTCPIDGFRCVRNHCADKNVLLLPLSAKRVFGNLSMYNYPKLHHKLALEEVIQCVQKRCPLVPQPSSQRNSMPAASSTLHRFSSSSVPVKTPAESPDLASTKSVKVRTDWEGKTDWVAEGLLDFVSELYQGCLLPHPHPSSNHFRNMRYRRIIIYFATYF
jgi:hypothetical protein